MFKTQTLDSAVAQGINTADKLRVCGELIVLEIKYTTYVNNENNNIWNVEINKDSLAKFAEAVQVAHVMSGQPSQRITEPATLASLATPVLSRQ
jgi:hypothetical protein